MAKLELNLGFYQARQIFELGYDFSPVCDRWDVSFLHACGQGFSHIIYRTDEQCPSSTEELRDYLYGAGTTSDINALIPLVPKLALEKCLPHVHADVIVVKYPIHDEIIIRGKDGKVTTCNSFSAFLWFHKHYPEELKAKFKEMMK